MPTPPVPVAPMPHAPAQVRGWGARPAIIAGSFTFALFLAVVWLVPDTNCETPACTVVSALIVLLVAEPFVATIWATRRAAGRARRVSMRARALISLAVSIGSTNGILLGELAGRETGSEPVNLLLLPFAAVFAWPVPFLVSMFTAWFLDGRRTVSRRRSPAPIRSDS